MAVWIELSVEHVKRSDVQPGFLNDVPNKKLIRDGAPLGFKTFLISPLGISLGTERGGNSKKMTRIDFLEWLVSIRFRRPRSDSIMGSSVVLTRAAHATPALALSTASSLGEVGDGVSGELLQPARTRKKQKAEREMCMMRGQGWRQ